MLTKRRTASVLLMTAMAACAAWSAPTEEQLREVVTSVRAKYAELNKAGALTPEARAETAREALKSANVVIAELDAQQIRTLSMPLTQAGEESIKATRARLALLAGQQTVDGFLAAALVLQFMDGDKAPIADQTAALRVALRHSALPEAAESPGGEITELLRALDGVHTKAMKDSLLDLGTLEASIPETAAPAVAFAGQMAFGAVMNLGPEGDGLRERFRQKFLAVLANATIGMPEERKARFESARKFFESRYAQGKLLNAPAPELTFSWSSDPSIKSMADLKGKVVVLDFWATWCGPCIASFPNIRELVRRYEGYPVAVIGVTSVQGYHIGKQGRVDTAGDPAKEHALMPEFMSWREMTWPVIFTEQPVFNPEFGVIGIPHVAIIDPAGKVRHNALRPSNTIEEEAEKIDALLKEAGLKTPPKG